MVAYYNEIDPFAAAWLRELISAGHIACGTVDERSIEDVRPQDLKGFTQVHLFAGIGVWSYALRQAGWPDDKPVWTGSCPCQPFSAAGKTAGFADERHLWPAMHWLIHQCKPPVVFGEQVASKAAEPWIDLVQADVEALGYAFGCVPFPSAGVGAPHIRDRAFWVAYADDQRPQGWGERGDGPDQRATRPSGLAGGHPCPTNGFWRNADWVGCRDRKFRPVEPGASPLVDGTTARMVLSCANCKTEIKSNDEVCILQKIDGRNERREPEEVLLSILHGVELCSGKPKGRKEEGSVFDPENGQMQPMRVTREPGTSSPRWERAQQRYVEFGGSLQEVSSASPQSGHREYVRSLLESVFRASEEKQDLFCPVCQGVGKNVCKKEVGSRVGLLRGYGNAINAEAAKAFIEVFIDG